MAPRFAYGLWSCGVHHVRVRGGACVRAFSGGGNRVGRPCVRWAHLSV